MGWGLGRGVDEERGKGEGEVEVKVGIVSVGWSREWVRGVVRGGWKGLGRGEEEVEVEVVANELAFDGGGGMGRYWGEGEGGIWTSEDKARVLREGFGVGGGGVGGVSVYVGDSATDLEALMMVDVGIVMRGEEMGRAQVGLMEVLERVGVECRWIGEFGGEGGEGGLWWARDFDEVCDSPLLRTLRERGLEV